MNHRSISDDDLCSGCMHRADVQGELCLSACAKAWPGVANPDGYIVSCMAFKTNVVDAEVVEHTAGPWRSGLCGGSVIADHLVVGGVQGADNIRFYGGYLIAESVAPRNIPIISAAPQLLEVANDFAEALTELGLLCECGAPECRTTKLRAAIAKARGIQP